MSEMPNTPENSHAGERWILLRDIAVMQGKLIVDGLRDLLLVPASLIAGLVSLITSHNGRPGPQFYHLLQFGKQTERWINLFGAVKNAPDDVVEQSPFGDRDIDDLVHRVESFVVDEYKRGGVTAQAKKRLDEFLDAMQRKKSDN
ncbi:MAG: hypothetical protein AAFN50_12605 [Pseudomonadota bacterium]